MPSAARDLDVIGHTPELAALVGGALLGAVIGVAVVATGGAALVAVAAAGAAGASAGGSIGQFVGSLLPPVTTGTLVAGAPQHNVLIGNQWAARRELDYSDCSGPPVMPWPHPHSIVAEGAKTVLINNQPAARIGDRLMCGATIGSGCDSVKICGPTASMDGIASEVPAWLEWTILALGLVGGAGMLRIFGRMSWVAVAKTMGGGMLGSFVGSESLGSIAAQIWGSGSWQPKTARFTGGILGAALSGGLVARQVKVPQTAGSIRNVNPTNGKQNCVNCAIATDATLAGRPTSALPGKPTKITVLEKYFGRKFRPVHGQAQITNAMTKAGPGARGIVFGGRKGGVGHVFNVVNQKGTVRYLDGQTGKSATFDGFSHFGLLRTN